MITNTKIAQDNYFVNIFKKKSLSDFTFEYYLILQKTDRDYSGGYSGC